VGGGVVESSFFLQELNKNTVTTRIIGEALIFINVALGLR
jgi:hypothetical protein